MSGGMLMVSVVHTKCLMSAVYDPKSPKWDTGEQKS